MAEHIAGSETEFVNRMNEKCKVLGMENTHFLNCCGLDDDIDKGHYSSAKDIAIMSRELIYRFPEVSEYATTWMDTITHVTRRGESEFGLTNTNKLIRTYEGITGLKTGSTSKAKYCLSATAKRNGINLIAVVLGAPTPVLRFKEASMLLDYGFGNCSIYEDKQENFSNQYLPIIKGKEEQVEILAENEFSYICLAGEHVEDITKTVNLLEKVEAPVKKGDIVGTIDYYMNGAKIGSVHIIANDSVEKMTYMDCLEKMVYKFFLRKNAEEK